MAELTIADHAEAWQRKQGKEVPARGTDEWKAMYEAWAHWAFNEACKHQKSRPPICCRRSRLQSRVKIPE